MTIARARQFKHAFGSPNPVIAQEEEIILAEVDKAIRSSGNAQIIGRNGELPLLRFFERHLPYTLRPVTGHFVVPSGELSPQMDIMIVDGRYPLLAQNLDGSVVVMLHSLLHIIEVKTTLTIPELRSTWGKMLKCLELERHTLPFWGTTPVGHQLFTYRTAVRLKTLANRHRALPKPEEGSLDITVLRLPEKDRLLEFATGVELCFEHPNPKNTKECYPTLRLNYTPLSDLYFEIVQSSYYFLSIRDYSFNDIGRHFADYMTWTTYKDTYN